MSSKAIYCSKYAYHYTYRIINIENGMKYIGVHSCDCLPEEDIGVKYFSSSTDKKFLKEQKEFPNRFTYEIIMVWATRREAFLHERFLLLMPNAARSPVYYNRHNGGINFDTSGRVTVKDNIGNTLQVSVDDPRYISGELYSISKDKIPVKDKYGQFYQISRDDPRYLSGELIFMFKGKTTARDKNGNTLLVPIDDPRYHSGELEHFNKGKILVKDKNENVTTVFGSDPRYLSGELVGIWKGKSHKSSTKEKMSKSAKERLKNPKNHSQFGTMWINNGYENKKIKKDTPIPDGFIKGRKMKFI